MDDCVLYRIVPLTTTEAIVSLCDEPCFFPPLVLQSFGEKAGKERVLLIHQSLRHLNVEIINDNK